MPRNMGKLSNYSVFCTTQTLQIYDTINDNFLTECRIYKTNHQVTTYGSSRIPYSERNGFRTSKGYQLDIFYNGVFKKIFSEQSIQKQVKLTRTPIDFSDGRNTTGRFHEVC